jgi:hypothetical protein
VDILRRAALAATVAFLLNATVRIAVKSVVHVPEGFEPFAWPPIFFATVIGVGAGAIVYAALVRYLGDRANQIFRWVSYSLMVLSFATPIILLLSVPPQYPGTTPLTAAALEFMHITTAVSTVAFLTRKRSVVRPNALEAT